jgi:hypothetical protein
MAIKPSKYTLRKQNNGSMNYVEPPKSNILSDNKEKIEYKDEKDDSDNYRDEFSTEVFTKNFRYKGFINYGVIGTSFTCISVHSRALILLFSNDIINQKYRDKEICNIKEKEEKYWCCNMEEEGINNRWVRDSVKFPINIKKIKDIEHLIDLNDTGVGGYLRFSQDIGSSFQGFNTLVSLYILNKDKEQIVDYLSYFSMDRQKEILKNSLNDILTDQYSYLKRIMNGYPAVKSLFEEMEIYFTAMYNEIDILENIKSNATNKIKVRKF